MFNIPSFFGFRANSGGAPFEFTVKTDNAGVSTSTQFQLPLVSSLPLNAFVYWGDGTYDRITTFNQAQRLHTYPSAGTYTIRITGALSGWQFNDGGDKLKMLNVVNWGALNISVNNGFNGCTNLTCSATDAPLITTSDLFNCFRMCTNFNGAIGSWNVSSVTSMNAMFAFASNFNQPIGNWNVSNVTNFQNTFFLTPMFNQNLSTWNVSSALTMSGTFRSSGFNQPIGNWNVSNVTSMQQMFANANAFNQDIGSWNISKVFNFGSFMENKTAANYSATNLDSIYNGWSSRPVNPNLNIDFGTIKFTAAGVAGKAILTGAPNNWTIIDGGL